MRPLSLTLQAFSAYGGRQELDFAALGPHRLFLISGPTGAGKTTVLDGICYALFGESSGAERGAAHLRSHHAEAGTPTEVTFDFALGAERWRAWRKPAHQRPKLRGSGFVTEPAGQALWPITDSGLGRPIERDAEMRERIRGLLGYHAGEFRQVVLLPQGRFRELLSASPGDRQKILTTLFGTSLYKHIEAALAEAAKAAEAECARLAERRRTLLAQAGAADRSEAQGAREAMAGELALAESTRGAAAAEERAARAAADSGRRDAERIKARDDAEGRLAALRAEVPAIDADRDRLDAARRADRLGGEREAVSAAREAWERAAALAEEDAATAEARRAALAAAEAALTGAPAREAEAAAATAEAGRLQGVLDIAERVADADSALDAARARGAAEEARRETAVRASLAAAADAEAAAKALAEREAVAAQAERHRLAVEATAARAEDTGALARTAAEAAARRGALATARHGLVAAEAAHAEARDARAEGARRLAAGHAAALAAGLRPGEPCPVCGGTHHPAPAAPAEAGLPLPALAALDAEEGRATHGLEAARAAARDAETELRLLAQREAALRARLGPEAADAPAGSLAAALDEARAALAAAEGAAGALPRLGRARDAATEREAAAAKAAGAAVEAAQKAATALAGALATAAERRAALPPGCAGPEALRAAIAAATRTAHRLEEALRGQREARARAEAAAEAAVQSARRSAAEAAHRAAERARLRGELEESARRAGFADVDASNDAVLVALEQDALARRIGEHDGDMAAATEAAIRARAEAAGLAAPDLPALEAAVAAAERRAWEAADAATTARNALDARDALLAQILAAERGLEAAQAEYGVKRELAKLARGDNPKRLSLEGFVLRSLFDEALAAANRRLRDMLSGRYLIRRRDEPERKNEAVGLGMEVLDQWNDQVRPAGTLSGGEGFCASLALALGLADTVQAHAGARRIDSLFIDEGFGTLDTETLETAMEVLTKLHNQDRLVGIISHVPELRGWIPARLEVTPGRRGSSAAFQVG